MFYNGKCIIGKGAQNIYFYKRMSAKDIDDDGCIEDKS